MRWWAWAVTLFAGLTMVSNVRYYSFKTINLKKSVPFLEAGTGSVLDFAAKAPAMLARSGTAYGNDRILGAYSLDGQVERVIAAVVAACFAVRLWRDIMRLKW